jgi:putative salt-induced outer membrane protein YdiY
VVGYFIKLIVIFSSGAISMTTIIKHHLKAAAAAVTLGLLALLAVGPAPVRGEEEKQGLLGPWKATAELSYVVTGGNTATSAFSLGTTFKRNWEKDALTIKTFALRSNATTVTRTAVGTETVFDVVELKTKRLMAENYLLAAQYDHRLSKKVVAQFGFGWDRNRFAGVASRVIFSAGTGYAWVETKRTQFKTDAGLTYTLRKYIGQSATSFAGFRGMATFEQKILETSSFFSQFIFDENLKRMVDWRYDWTNSVSASISKSLALKTSLRLLYAHLPADEAVPLFDPNGLPTDLFVPVPLKKVDTFFTTSIVINF